MATGNVIDAKLRIISDAAQAIADLRKLRGEVQQTGAAVKRAAADGDAGGGSGTATQDRQAARREAAADREAQRAVVVQQREALRVEREARRAAAEEGRKLRAEERKAAGQRGREEQEAARVIKSATNIQAQAYRQLPAQISDITTSLASGMPVWMVATQQGLQIKDSFGGWGAASRGLLSVLTPLRLVVGGVALAIGGLAVTALAGWRNTDQLNKALAVTGQQGRISLGQIDTKARSIAANSGAAIGDVRETLAELVATGEQTANTLGSTGRAVTAYRKLTGASADEAVKLFNGQRDAVLDWATKANKAYNFLTAAQLQQIRTLQAQGRNDEAVRLANEELAKTLEQRTAPAIGAVEKAWNKVAAVVSGIIDKVKGLGREETIDDKIRVIQEQLASLEPQRDQAVGATRENMNQRVLLLQQQLSDLVTLKAQEDKRRAERSIADKNEQQKAYEQSRGYQDALAGVEAAGLQKRLALRLAELDKEQSAVEQARAAELISEQERNQRLNTIDQARLEGQAATLRRQLEIERNRVVEKPEDLLAKQAAVAQLEAQLIGLQSQLTQAAAKGQELLAADATDQAAKWEQAWRDAAERIRRSAGENAATAAGRIADPAARAREAGQLATADDRRELALQQRAIQLRIDLTLDPANAAALQQQLDKLTSESLATISERDRKARFESLQQSFEQLTAALSQSEADLDALVDQGATDTETAEQRKLDARARTAAQLREIVALMDELAAAGTQAERNQVAAANGTARAFSDLRTELGKTAKQSAIAELAQGLTDIETNAKSAGQALKDMVLGFAKSLLNVLNQKLAEKLVNSLLSSIDKTGEGGKGGGIGTALSAFGTWFTSLFHTGGVIGAGAGRMARAVAPAVFAGAQILHTGGLVAGTAGLKPNERAVIAEVGEEMLTEDNPRHIKNFKGGGFTYQASYTINGGGSEADQVAFAQGLDRRIRTTIDQYVADQQRQGGRLSGVRRG